ncbi:DUF1206 domain-containing protein [Capilliphycus salinus ALCB114379]|uniref:DUF1206 domain-containing protein n=1 Tax=Capilliphycus salinus TaxID=2768948 RepID=UPI0039A5918B
MWIERLARFGYATKGAVYGLIGLLALMAAFSSGGKTTGTRGALRTIAAQPLGQILLALIAVGLVGYAIWRIVEAIQDPDRKGSDFKGIVTRIGYIISGLIYASLAFNAALLAIGAGGGGGGDSKQTWTARLLSQPFGQWLVGTIGAILIGIGLYRIYKAYRIKFRKKLNLRELDYKQEKWVVNVCRFGITARGVIFMMLGFFLIQAARQFDPSEVQGLDGALQTLARQPYGKFLLAIAAFGLVAYAVYMFVQARYRQIQTY